MSATATAIAADTDTDTDAAASRASGARRAGARLAGIRPVTRLWALFLVALLVTGIGVGVLWGSSSERIRLAEASVTLTDGVDPTLPGVVSVRSQQLVNAIRFGSTPPGVTVEPYDGQNMSQADGYTDPDEAVVITYARRPSQWGLIPQSILDPAGFTLIAGVGMLLATGFLAAGHYAARPRRERAPR